MKTSILETRQGNIYPFVCPQSDLQFEYNCRVPHDASILIEKVQEGDIARLLDILYAALHDDSWNQIMLPQITPQDGRLASTKRWRNEISVDPNKYFMKVVDTANDHDIVAFAR